MKAMILAAGRGTRLGEITQTTPKCLVSAGGKAMLEHVVDRLKHAGVTSIVINLHHLAGEVENFVKAKSNFGIDIQFSLEDELLDTGGGLKKVEPFFSGETSFFLHNADVYSDLDLNQMMAAHLQSGAIATLGVMSRQTSRFLVFDEKDSLVGWENPKDGRSDICTAVREPQRLAFSGIQVLSTKIFGLMQEEPSKFSTISIFLKAIRHHELVKAYRMDSSYWHDVGTPALLEELRRKLGS